MRPTRFSFTRRQAREALSWNASVAPITWNGCAASSTSCPTVGGNGKLCRYSLLYDGRGREGQPALIGLVDAASLVEPTLATMTGHLAQDRPNRTCLARLLAQSCKSSQVVDLQRLTNQLGTFAGSKPPQQTSPFIRHSHSGRSLNRSLATDSRWRFHSLFPSALPVRT